MRKRLMRTDRHVRFLHSRLRVPRSNFSFLEIVIALASNSLCNELGIPSKGLEVDIVFESLEALQNVGFESLEAFFFARDRYCFGFK